MKAGLTPRQKECLDFIKSYIGQFGYSPSYEEIMLGIGTKSKSCIYHHIVQLVERGYISMSPGKRRSVAILEAA